MREKEIISILIIKPLLDWDYGGYTCTAPLDGINFKAWEEKKKFT